MRRLATRGTSTSFEIASCAAESHRPGGQATAPRVGASSEILNVVDRVRAATRADSPAMKAVYYRAWKGAYEPFLDPALVEELAAQRARDLDWSRGIRAPDAGVFVGIGSDGSVTGVAQANEVLDPPRDLPEITMLYVDPAAWGSGLASSLLAAGVAWIVGQGHRAARLRVVDGHLRARRFYEREGWSLDGELEPVATGLARLVYYRRSLNAQ